MNDTSRTIPRLHVETSRIDDVRLLIPLLDSRHPLLWMRKGHGMAGIGEAIRLEFRGPDRMLDAGRVWREVAAAATVADPLQSPGTGLVAFGTFAFSEHSALVSTLIVPEILVGRRDGVSWLTRVTVLSDDDRATPSPLSHGLPPAHPLGTEYRLSLLPGQVKPDDYRASVAAATTRIASGELNKVVLARDLVGHMPAESDLRRALTDLALGYPDCWTYAVDGLIGSSPETLVRVDHGTVSARVLAGTESRGRDALADHDAAISLATSTKDLDEHRFAVASVVDALSPHTERLTTSEIPFTLKLPNLWHLATDTEGILSDGSTSLDLIAALHPTAAVAGAPTDVALGIIDELEPFDRGRYAGPVGWVGADGDGEWAVALRCAQIAPNGDITAYAGAGIVAESDPDHEFLETKMKFRPVVEAFS